MRIVEATHVNYSLLLLQVLNFVLLAAWILLAIWALWRLRKEEMSDTAQVIWTLVILLIPILGAAAYFVVRSRSEGKQ
jgi:large-conductance mechanosensitive channel